MVFDSIRVFIWLYKHIGVIVLFLMSLIMLSVIPAGILFATSPFRLMNNMPTALLVIGTFFYTFINFLFDFYEYLSKIRKNGFSKERMLNIYDVWKIYKSLLGNTIAMTVLMVSIYPFNKNFFVGYFTLPYSCASGILFFSCFIIAITLGNQTRIDK